MQKKTLTRKLINYEDALNVAAKEEVSITLNEVAFFSSCQKFQQRPTDPAPVDRAIHFLFLKEHNVDRRTALQFGKRRLCKIDSTRQFDGPAEHRIMKTSKIISGAINGWHNGAHEVKFNLGTGFTEISKTEDYTMNSLIDKRVQISERDQKEMERYAFSKLNSQGLTQKLSKLKEEKLFKQPKNIVEVGGQKLIHLLEQPNKPSLLQQFDAFSTIEDQARLIQQQSMSNLLEPTRLRQRAMTNLQEFKTSRKRNSEITSNTYRINLNTTRKNSHISFFFTTKQTLPSNTSLSNSQTQQTNQKLNFEQRVENFVKQRLQIQNSKSYSPEIDCTKLQKKKDEYQILKQKEIKRIQKVRQHI